ncbi:MAG: hypothetical protein IT208_14975 [Chthonomonadales bacterium]|nr:hypothetical protein [Chthonomonadales bacterium]
MRMRVWRVRARPGARKEVWEDGQLLSITSGGATVDYAYDALGRRFSRTAGGVTTETLYAGTLPLLEKQGSNWTAAYAWGSGQIRRNGEYPLTDLPTGRQAATAPAAR